MLDAAALSHVVAWVIGGVSAIAAVTIVGASIALGRAGYRKD